jgi:hypothetical protein
MRFWHKLVSCGVLEAVLLLPLLSIGVCAPQSASAMQCPPDCPMMAEMNSGHDGMEMKFSEVPASCCQFKSSNPAPVTESKTVAPTVSVEPTVVDTPLPKKSQARTTAFVDTSPPVAPDFQTQLCTFRI